jgi:hypothetical protein
VQGLASVGPLGVDVVLVAKGHLMVLSLHLLLFLNVILETMKLLVVLQKGKVFGYCLRHERGCWSLLTVEFGGNL